MKQTQVELEIEDEVGRIILRAPEGKPPTLDRGVLVDLEARLQELEAAPVRLAFLESSNARFFCVGANIEVLKNTNEETIVPWVMLGHRVLNRLEDLPFPVVAVVRGYAMGGGLELAMACDLIFASEAARFAQSEARLGFIPGWGGCHRLVERVGRAKAKYYFYSGKMLEASEALASGLIDYADAEEALQKHLLVFADEVCQSNSNAVSTFKKLVNGGQRSQRDENASLEALNSVSCLKDPDTLVRLNAFLNRKK